MSFPILRRTWLLLAAACTLFAAIAPARAAELLVADRLSNSVYRYSAAGDFLGVLLQDNVNLNQPSGIQLSPDKTKLYVASSQNGKVISYDYNGTTATNPQVFASGLVFPNSVIFSPDGSKVYVSQLGGGGVAQFNSNGTSAGSALVGGSSSQLSGLAFAPSGQLLVGAFADDATGVLGGVERSNAGLSSLTDFIAPAANLWGVGNLLVDGNDLYVTAGFAGLVKKYDATTGAVAGGFTAPSGLGFPASITLAPDGNGLLVGSLGFAAGGGNISRFGFDGTALGLFKAAQANPALGFTEPTGLLVVPEPSSIVLAGSAVAALAMAAMRRRRS
ncbi:MAG: SMP-30/gluconolactonase/LRE family protein [Pirellulales bacterium]|nr:SMP-30/gluconolactonase/LRE family protein [Pirellulales bacterium]